MAFFSVSFWLEEKQVTHLKINPLSKALLVSVFGGSALMLSACNTVSDAWNFVTDDSDDSLRTPTGYYEHTDAQELQDPLAVPSDLSQPFTDRTLDVPPVVVSDQSRTMVGERMDVRPPVVSQVNEMGVEIMNQNGDAVVWFLPYNSFNVRTVDEAWRMLNATLDYLKVPVAESNPNGYAIATQAADYNSSGELYDDISYNMDALRYRQVYKVNVGTSPQGQVGFYVTLISSTTATADGDDLAVSLNPRQKQSFSVGFANSLIRGLELQQRQEEVIPDNVNVFLGRDNNNQDALLVRAPYQSTWNVMRGVLSQYGFTVDEYSVSRSYIDTYYAEEDADYYRALGLEPFNIESADYIFRLAVSGEQTVITIYDSDDRPLSGQRVAALYPGLSQAIAREFAIYKREGANYLAKFEEED